MKRQIKNIVLLFSFLMFTLPVRAAEDTVTLTAEKNTVEAVLLQGTGEAGTEEIVSLQLSFQIDSGEKRLKQDEVSFEFNSSLVSTVKQYRYHPDTGLLNIYVSGSEHVTGKENVSGKISLGKIVITPAADTVGTYTVKVKDNSLKTVNGAFYMEEPDLYAQAEEKVQIGSTEEGKEDTDKKEEDWITDSNTGDDSKDSKNDWFYEEEEKRIPINNGHPSSGIFTTSRNPGTINSNIPDVSVNTDNSQKPPGSNLSESKEQPVESTSSDVSRVSEGSKENNGKEEISEKHSESAKEAEQNRNGKIEVTEKPDVPDETETEGETKTSVQDTEELMRREETAATKRTDAGAWIVAVLAVVIIAAAAAIVILARNGRKHTGRKNIKR